MSRAFLLVMDSVGIGGAPDAAEYFNGDVPDTGANTLGHIAQACAAGQAEEGRSGPLHVPTLAGLGIGKALTLASGLSVESLAGDLKGAYGTATEASRGKDTPSGHWELAGRPVPFDWHTFPDKVPSFPPDVTAALCQAGGTEAILANCHASGTEVIARFGEEHIRTGWPICYTSADSVLQIAAHEEHFGLERLYALCRAVAPMLHEMKVGRVIARPFLGTPGDFSRTANRKDFALEPPQTLLCDWAAAEGRDVHAVGKIGDIFSMRGISDLRKGRDDALMQHVLDLTEEAADGALIFANFVEFDSEYGHRRDISGYARHLEWFDAGLARVIDRLRPDDLLVVTADHGNDPSWVGTDHTREQVPVLVHGIGARALGPLAFSDVAVSIAQHLAIPAEGPGKSFL